MYSVILGQCTEAMRSKLEGDDTFAGISKARDAILLLKLLRQISFNYVAKTYPFLALHTALKNYYAHHQGFYTTCDTYQESYQNHQEVVEHCGGQLDITQVYWNTCLK